MKLSEELNFEKANIEFKKSNYDLALDLYKQLQSKYPDFKKILDTNINLCIRRKGGVIEKKINDEYIFNHLENLGNIEDDLELIKLSGLFDIDYYLSSYPDVRESKIDPIKHYLFYGWKEGRNPSRYFDTKFYLENYCKSNNSLLNPLVDFIRSGYKKRLKINWRGSYFKKNNKNFLAKERKFGSDFSDIVYSNNQLISYFSKYKNIVEVNQEIIDKARAILDNKEITFSVIVPVWNREKTVLKAIESIKKQTYKAREIIIVDDGSDDRSCEIIEDFYKDEITSGEIILIKNKHMGVSEARNAGLAVATSEMIAYLDSDNTWNPNHLLIMAALFSSCSEVNTAYAGLKYINQDENLVRFLGGKYKRDKILQANFIDMNVFVHRRFVYQQVGGFDEKLKRLVDWDFILKCTKNYTPVFLPYSGVNYYINEKELGNITKKVPLKENRDHIYRKNVTERLRFGLDNLRIAYVLWDWPTLSQTFVLEEIKWLVENGEDIVVYYKVDPDKSAFLDFKVDTFKVNDHEHLSRLLIEHNRNIVHSHFAYPAVTLLTYPACKATGIKFTFYAHAVDIFHNENKKRNHIGSIVSDDLCLRVFTHGDFHRRVLEDSGVPRHKIFYALQAIDINHFFELNKYNNKVSSTRKVITFIGRFVEKKGVDVLLDAALNLIKEKVEFHLYGYGPLYEEINKKISSLHITNVILKDSLSGAKEVAAVLKNSDALVVPSIIAKNGDSEGFSTVIFEAMASGIPVISSNVSSIPHYLKNGVDAILVKPGDSKDLEAGIRKFLSLSNEERRALIVNAKNFLNTYVGVEKTISSYFDVWFENRIDIFLVTFNNEKYENSAETEEIIKRILSHTTTPFALTIVDNNSDKEFNKMLLSKFGSDSRIRFIFEKNNIFCGPSSNIALTLSDAVYAIYVCSKEGFVAKHGWERPILKRMKDDPEKVIGGHLVHLPKYTLGSEIIYHPDFNKFREKFFALKNPDRVFKHVQGGVYVIKRDVFERVDFFNPLLPQGNMDVEFSYYLEARGFQLKEIPEIKSVTVKTRPFVTSVIDENVSIAHPFKLNDALNTLDNLMNGENVFCNICGCKVDNHYKHNVFSCCGSTPFGRTIFKKLAYDHRAYRGEKCLIIHHDKALIDKLSEKMFIVKSIHPENSYNEIFDGNDLREKFSIIIYDVDALGLYFSKSKLDSILKKLNEYLKKGGCIFFTNELFGDFLNENIYRYKDEKSNVLREDWRSVYKIGY